MIRVGEYNTLRVKKDLDFGLILDDGKEGILLPKRFVPRGARPGDDTAESAAGGAGVSQFARERAGASESADGAINGCIHRRAAARAACAFRWRGPG